MTKPHRARLTALSAGVLAISGQVGEAQQPRTVPPTPRSGFWVIAIPGPDTIWNRLTLRFDRDSITGANAGGAEIRGMLHNDSVRFSLLRADNGGRVVFAGTLRGDTIRGTRTETAPGAAAPRVTQVFIATPDVPSRAARRVVFEPQVFHRAFTGAAPPALRVIPGDTVRTWTVDNAGRDSTGTSRTPGGNPLTGPFFIEGAQPGDVIAVRLLRVRLNRNWGDAGSSLVWNALTADYVRGIKEEPGFNRRWRLDRERGVAMLEQPTPGLHAFAVPLRPMLGCLGVSPPAGQVIRSQDSGPFGGNMDYNAIGEGATVYLPVFQRGALLFMGDGHAVQGDGELTGDAVETSMDVEFSVELLRQHRIRTPRAEDDEFLMAIGISGDLSDALREATAELSRWLDADYGVTAPELASVLGTSMRYDVADLVGTQVSIVAKVPKAALRQLRRPSGREVPPRSGPPAAHWPTHLALPVTRAQDHTTDRRVGRRTKNRERVL